MKVILPTPSNFEKKLCSYFSEECAVSNVTEYSKRNQSNINKISKDIYYGKIAEILVFNYLISKGKKASPPDFMIYESKMKSFDADIKVEDVNIHVKSCLDSSKFPNSWLFQPNDPVIKQNSDKDILALVVISKKPYVYFRKINTVKFESPVKKYLNKLVIYERSFS